MIAHDREREEDLAFRAFALTLLRRDLLAARFDAARWKIESLTDDEVGPYAQPLLRGALDFLEGRNDEALARFREALKLFKKAQGRSKIFFDGMNGKPARSRPSSNRRKAAAGRRAAPSP